MARISLIRTCVRRVKGTGTEAPTLDGMPRFYFDILGSGASADRGGFDLPDEASAREHAKAYVRELLREGAASGWDTHNWRVVVTDGNDRIVADVQV